MKALFVLLHDDADVVEMCQALDSIGDPRIELVEPWHAGRVSDLAARDDAIGEVGKTLVDALAEKMADAIESFPAGTAERQAIRAAVGARLLA